MLTLYLLNVYVHVLSAVVWIGGMLFLGLVAVPIAQRMEPRAAAARFVRMVGRRFRPIAWICICLLVATGIVNLYYRGVTPGYVLSGDLFQTVSGRLLAIKVALVALVIALSFLHDFIIGPRLAAAMEQALPAEADRRTALRRMVSRLARANVLLALVVLGLAVAVARL